MTVAIHPELAANGSFAHLKLGRVKKARDPRTLLLAKYLDDAVALPAVPASADYTAKVASWPMYGNDSYGDCTCAAAGHMVQAWTAAAGAEHDPTIDQVEGLYWATGSPPNEPCQPGGPTDTGRFEGDVLDYWRQTGFGGHMITAWAAVDASNLDHVRAAIYLFGGVYVGVELPRTAQGQSVWDVVPGMPDQNRPGSWGGHAVPYEAYDADGFTCVTWGAPLRVTNAFHAEYTDEVYAVISPEWLAGDVDLHGFDLQALEADLAEITQQ